MYPKSFPRVASRTLARYQTSRNLFHVLLVFLSRNSHPGWILSYSIVFSAYVFSYLKNHHLSCKNNDIEERLQSIWENGNNFFVELQIDGIWEMAHWSNSNHMFCCKSQAHDNRQYMAGLRRILLCAPLHETLITVLPTFLTKAMQYISRILSLMLTPSSPHPSKHVSVFVFKKIWLC